MTASLSFDDEILPPLTQIVMDNLRRFKEAGTPLVPGEDFAFLTRALSRAAESKAQLSQDLWVLFELREKRRGWFVDFGAGDGETISNSWLLETQYGWRGVLAEPNPAFHAKLALRKAAVCTDCVTDRTGDNVVFNQTADPHFSTLDNYTAADMHARARASGQRTQARTISLNDLLRRNRAPRFIDYLSMDTEGSELMILEAFDFSRWTFATITIEHNFGPTRDRIRTLLESHGYRRKFEPLTRFDDWYVNDEALARLRPRGRASARGQAISVTNLSSAE